MVIGKRGVLILLLSIFLLSVVAAAGDVAYIYRRSSKIDENVVEVFSDMGLDVELIDEQDLSRTDFSNYKFLFVGDERLRNEDKIPVDKYPTIVANSYYGREFGLTDKDGVSKLASTSPLNVKKAGELIQVYTKAKFDGGATSIPYYFLDDKDKAPMMQSVARTYSGSNDKNLGDVISYAYAGTDLVNGKETDKKVCFFGIIESDYWTSAARDLFEDCASFVGITCEDDDECPDDEEGDEFCKGDDVYVGVESYDCEDAGTFESECVRDEDEELVERCDEICVDGKCVDVECMNDSECGDGDDYTFDYCENPATVLSKCKHEPIICLGNSNCGVDGFVGDRTCEGKNVMQDYKSFICSNKGTVNSECSSEIEPRVVEECAEGCVDGSCFKWVCVTNEDCDDSDDYTADFCRNPSTIDAVCEHEPIRCWYADDCDDSSARTFDECLLPGTVESECRNTEMNCLSDSDCGVTGFLGESFCDDEDVWKTYQTSVCENAATLDSFCEISVGPEMIQDCDDENDYTIDTCVENGHAYCEHEFLECLDDGDCDDDYYSSWENICKGDDVWKMRDFHDFGCAVNFCEEEVSLKEVFVEECEFGCAGGECLDGCYSDEECGEISYSEWVCEGSFRVRDKIIPVCEGGDCGEVVEEESGICLYGCLDGKCLEPECEVGEDCGNVEVGIVCEGDDLVETTILPICVEGLCGEEIFEDVTWCEFGCANDECIEPSIECYENSDCGEDRWIGEQLCVDEDVYQNYKVFTCLNPGEPEAKCVDQVDLILKRVCDDLCVDGFCEDVLCWEDSDCGFIGFLGDEFCEDNDVFDFFQNWECVSAGTPEASCEQLVFDEKAEDCGESGCGEWENYCVGDDAWHKRDCIEKSCELGMCLADDLVEDEFVKECEFGCAGGECEEPECVEDEDCGDVEISIECEGDDLVETIITPICVDGGCDEVVEEEVTVCEFGCAGGECKDKPICLVALKSEDQGNVNIKPNKEKSLQQIFLEKSLLIDVNEQNNFQIWEFGPEVESVYLEISHLGGITKHNDVFGYYLDSAGTFQSINNFGAGEKRTIQIERNNKDFIGFGILDKNTNDLWVTEKDKNWDKLQHAVIYNYSEGNYAFGFEDLKNQGDADYQDVVLNVEVLECVFS